MLAIGHTAVGTLIGVAATQLVSPNHTLTEVWPLIVMSALLGLASHYATDHIPHGHYNIDIANPSTGQTLKLLADTILPWSIIGAFLLLSYGWLHPYTWIITATILGAQLPDILHGLRQRRLLPNWQWLIKESHLHHRAHHKHDLQNKALSTPNGSRKILLSDLWQLAVIILAALSLITMV